MGGERVEPRPEQEPGGIYLTGDDAREFVRASCMIDRIFSHAQGKSFRPANVPFPSFYQQTPVGESQIPLETVETIIAVMKRAVEVLGSADKAEQWLRTPVPSLGEMPIALLRTAEGAAKVENALLAIEDGTW